MSEQESDNTNTINSEKLNSFLEIPLDLKEKIKNIPEALKFIEKLQKHIKKQTKRIKKIKSKLKKHKKDMGVQTDFLDTGEQIKEASNLIEEIKEAAELATQESGFIYDEVSGLYYHSNTGYYYNAEYGLYYDSKTGIYMNYNEKTNSYTFHSQVHQPHVENTKDNLTLKRKQLKDEFKVNKIDLEQVINCFNSLSIYNNNYNIKNLRQLAADLSKQWPPCMRIIVEQSTNPKIKVGTLYIITYEGGTVGREGDYHSITLPDQNISKVHLKFSFDMENNHFIVVDMGSRNGTVLNGKRLAVSKQESEQFIVEHGSRIQISSVVLLCHIHDGNQTCGHCEPGLIQQNNEKVELTATLNKSEQHKHQLKQIRKKFGLNKYEENTKLAKGYTDRAQHRRNTIGSQNPHEKTDTASLDKSIPSQNKGFKLLAKMGWKEGDALGKDKQGMTEPIPLISNPGTSGMGNNNESTLLDNPQIDKAKNIVWKKTQERFKKLPPVNIFIEDSD